MPFCLIAAAARIATTLAFQLVGVAMAVAVSLPGGSTIGAVRAEPASAPAVVAAEAQSLRQDAVATAHDLTAPTAPVIAGAKTLYTSVRRIALHNVSCTAGEAVGTATASVPNVIGVPAALPAC